MGEVRLVVVAGTTETVAIDGISAAGADPELRVHTPSADLEIVEAGRPAPGSPVPVSPSGCPTPAVVTRAVRELLGPESLPVEFLDAGLGAPTAATVRDLGASTGGDLRDPEPVPEAAAVFERARSLAPELAGFGDKVDPGSDGGDEPAELLVAETIPGGTTTALG
ncbi:TIGR00303 family protein, partial [Halorubrum sp. C3]